MHVSDTHIGLLAKLIFSAVAAGSSQGPSRQALLPALSQHQLPYATSNTQALATSADPVLQSTAVCAAATAVADMRLTDGSDEETTMCLRDQLIHSRCTDPKYVLNHARLEVQCLLTAILSTCASMSQPLPDYKTGVAATCLHNALAVSVGTTDCHVLEVSLTNRSPV